MSSELTQITAHRRPRAPMATMAFVAKPALQATSFGWRVLPAVVDGTTAAARAGLGLLRMPFDSARTHYAQGVRAGLIERSMLASRDFECALHAMEQLTLGPLARRV